MRYSKVAILLFARMTSSRLPGKVLKKLDSIEILKICHKRLKLPGASVHVLTSINSSDDEIANYCKSNGINCFRGSLDFPAIRLREFVELNHKYNMIVRATADNIFPDWHLAKDLVDRAYKREALDRYEFVAAGLSGLPKGLALEVIGVDLLEQLVFTNNTADILEHITVDLRKKFKDRIYGGGFGLNVPNISISIDTAEDFDSMRLFWKDDFIDLHYMELIKKYLKFNGK